MDKEKFHKAQEDCQKVVDWLNIPLDDPEFSDDLIAFNGAGDDAYENFYVSRLYRHPFLNNPQITEDGYFAFCKTARRPYDAAVTACLCYFKGHKFTPISNQSIRSHCERCGVINPEDWSI